MDMIKTVNELTEGMNSMMELIKRKTAESLFEDESFDADIVELMRGLTRMSDLSMRLVKEQTTTIQEINNKLDKLLEKA